MMHPMTKLNYKWLGDGVVGELPRIERANACGQARLGSVLGKIFAIGFQGSKAAGVLRIKDYRYVCLK